MILTWLLGLLLLGAGVVYAFHNHIEFEGEGWAVAIILWFLIFIATFGTWVLVLLEGK